jgi:hypothetical protein
LFLQLSMAWGITLNLELITCTAITYLQFCTHLSSRRF